MVPTRGGAITPGTIGKMGGTSLRTAVAALSACFVEYSGLGVRAGDRGT